MADRVKVNLPSKSYCEWGLPWKSVSGAIYWIPQKGRQVNTWRKSFTSVIFFYIYVREVILTYFMDKQTSKQFVARYIPAQWLLVNSLILG